MSTNPDDIQDRLDTISKTSIYQCLPEASNSSQYTHEDRINAASYFVMYGNITKVSELTGISPNTLYDWKNKTEWWHDLIGVIREERGDEIDAGFQKILLRGLDEQLDRIENGDVTLSKDGDEVRTPVKLRDLTVATGIALDKLRIIRNQAPPSASGGSDKLATLAERMVDLLASKEEKVVSEQVQPDNSINPLKAEE